MASRSNGKSLNGKHLNGNSRVRVAGKKSGGRKPPVAVPAPVLEAQPVHALEAQPIASEVSSAGLAHRFRQRRIAEVDRRALNDRAGFVDHDTKPPVFGEEGQAMPAEVGVDPALGKARDPARAHLFLQQGQAPGRGLRRRWRRRSERRHFRIRSVSCVAPDCVVAAVMRAPGSVWPSRDRRIPPASWRRARA